MPHPARPSPPSTADLLYTPSPQRPFDASQGLSTCIVHLCDFLSSSLVFLFSFGINSIWASVPPTRVYHDTPLDTLPACLLVRSAREKKFDHNQYHLHLVDDQENRTLPSLTLTLHGHPSVAYHIPCTFCTITPAHQPNPGLETFQYMFRSI